MSARNKAAMYLAIISGIMLLVLSINGATAWEAIKDYVTENVADNEYVQLTFQILIFIAALGGLAVIIGGLLISKNAVGTGKFLIGLGAGLGLLGLLISVAVSYHSGEFSVWAFTSAGAVGVLLAVAAQVIAKDEDEGKGKKRKKKKK